MDAEEPAAALHHEEFESTSQMPLLEDPVW